MGRVVFADFRESGSDFTDGSLFLCVIQPLREPNLQASVSLPMEGQTMKRIIWSMDTQILVSMCQTMGVYSNKKTPLFLGLTVHFQLSGFIIASLDKVYMSLSKWIPSILAGLLMSDLSGSTTRLAMRFENYSMK